MSIKVISSFLLLRIMLQLTFLYMILSTRLHAFLWINYLRMEILGLGCENVNFHKILVTYFSKWFSSILLISTMHLAVFPTITSQVSALLCKMSIYVFYPFLYWIFFSLICKSSLNVLDTNL